MTPSIDCYKVRAVPKVYLTLLLQIVVCLRSETEYTERDMEAQGIQNPLDLPKVISK